ncbi:MAG: hypothetical protein IK125_00970 [Lachnospiraceae bacterium]|nr:hypothetical protein [Lachnospiraceae bacterium]
MKKIVAVLLSMAMMLSVSCANKDSDGAKDAKNTKSEDSDKKSSKGDKDSDDDSSDGKGKSGGDKDSDGDNSAKSADNDLKYVRDLKTIPITVERTEGEFYPREVTDDDYVMVTDEYTGEEWEKCIVPYTFYDYAYLKVEGDEYADIQAMLDAVQQPVIDELMDGYNKEVERLKNLDPAEYEKDDPDYFYSYMYVHRADTKAITFRIEQDIYSMSPETGKLITISDIVKDKTKFADRVISDIYFYETDYYSDEAISDEMKNLYKEQVRKQIEDDKLQFILNYDRIDIYLDELEYDGYTMTIASNFLSYSAAEYPEIFNLEWFGHTPEYYAIQPDIFGFGILYWDVNDDGITDAIRRETDWSGDGSLFPCTLYLNDETLELGLTDSRGRFAFMYLDDGRYIIVENCIVRVNDDGSMTLIGEDFPTECLIEGGQDPANFKVAITMDLLGSRSVTRQYTLLGNNGLPTPKSPYINKYMHPITSKKPVNAVLFDKDTGKDGEETTIESGSVFYVEEYDPDTNQILFRIEPKNGEAYYAKAEFVYNTGENGEPTYGGKVGGIEQNELFDGIQYGG